MDEQELIKIASEMSWQDFKTTFKKIAETDQEAALELLVAKCATDVELFAVIFFPHYCEREFNQFHIDLFESFQFGERKVRRVRAAPRGSAKSTIAALIRPIHDLCYGQEKFILFVSSTQDLAVPKLKDIRSEVLANSDLQIVYGVRFSVKKPSVSAFTCVSSRGETHFKAVGKDSQIRGIRYKQFRPTKIVFDDFESSEEVQNDRLRQKTEDIFHEEFGKTGDTKTNIEFVGTVLHKDALLPKLIDNPAYDSKLYKAVISWSEREDLWEKWRAIYRNLDNKDRAKEAMAFFEANKDEMLKGTEVMWPEKESYYDHMMDMMEIGKRAFFKEKQNQPLGLDEPVFERFHFYREVEQGFLIEETNTLVRLDQLQCIGSIDPSTGQTKPKKGKLGDFCVIATGYLQNIQGKKRLFVHHDWTKRASPTKQIEAIFDLNDRFGFDKFSVETNLYRNLLLPNILDEKKRREKAAGKTIRVPFYDCVQTENKIERIYTIEPKVNNGLILFNRGLSKEFMMMFEEFPFADHDDAPDVLEQLWSLAHNRYQATALQFNPMAGR